MENQALTLSALQKCIASAINEAFPVSLWVIAEIAELKVNYSGHCYMELVEKDESSRSGGIARAQARGVIWRNTFEGISYEFTSQTGEQLRPGIQILCQARVSYHPLYGLSLQINAIDPSFTLGDLERQKQQTITKLKQEGIWDMNHDTLPDTVVQRVAVVSSSNAAGYQDFMQELAKSPYRIHTRLFDATMQGAQAEQSIVSSLQQIALGSEDFDAVVIIRGGGSVQDLNCYNSYQISAYIAQFPLPVITGIGHDKDVSIADMVATLSLKTPTATAQWLIQRIDSFMADLETAALAVSNICMQQIHKAQLELQTTTSKLKLLSMDQLHKSQNELGGYSIRLVEAIRALNRQSKSRLEMLKDQLHRAALSLLRNAGNHLENRQTVVNNFSPENIIRLGFSVAHINGRLLTRAEDAHIGDELSLKISGGELKAKITDIAKKNGR